MAATQPPTSPTLPATTTPAATPALTNSFDDSMLVDEDAEGEDQLIDDIMPDAVASVPDHHLSTRSTPAPQHPSPEHGKAPAQKRRRVPESPPQALLEKSAKKREQREREKEQQKYLLNKLIEIFEEGGGTCAVQQGQKKFPWVELPAQLIKINSYFAGWPERCLPKMKREDRIDASTGPSQWSLKQKRAMEAQINKGAVKVLPRQPGRAVIFEVVDDLGNVKDSTIDFSDDWVRRKLLGQSSLAHSPIFPVEHVAHPSLQPTHPSISLDHLRHPTDVGHGVNANGGHVLPPIRTNPDPVERLELPSFAVMNGIHTPENLSRSPSPLSNFSESHSRLQVLHPSLRQGYASSQSHGRSSYPTPLSSHDESLHAPSRGRVLTLEHGLPRTAVSMRSTSRQTSTSRSHSHGYPPLLSSHHQSHLSLLSRPPSPLSGHHSVATPTSPSISPGSAAYPQDLSNAPSPSSLSTSSQRFPSHVPNVPGSVVAWDAGIRAWTLKLQHDTPSLPCPTSLICWYRDRDEWELQPSHPEPGRIVWSRALERWEFLISEQDAEPGFSASSASSFSSPTHFPEVAGWCIYDSEHLNAWTFNVPPDAKTSLPASPCVIVWDRVRSVWSLLPDPPQSVDISWSLKSRTWHFTLANGRHSHSNSPPSSRQLTLASESSVLPPMKIPPTPIEA